MHIIHWSASPDNRDLALTVEYVCMYIYIYIYTYIYTDYFAITYFGGAGYFQVLVQRVPSEVVRLLNKYTISYAHESVLVPFGSLGCLHMYSITSVDSISKA